MVNDELSEHQTTCTIEGFVNLKISGQMAGRLNIERVINTHTTVLRRKNSIIQHAPTSDIRRVRRDMVRVVLVFSKNNPLSIACIR